MTNPESHRESRRKPQGVRTTAGSPDTNVLPLVSPGPIGVGDTTEQGIDSVLIGAGGVQTCLDLRLNKAFMIGMATDKYLTPLHSAVVPDQGLKNNSLKFGQDITFGTGRPSPGGQWVATDEKSLKPMMKELLNDFASGDSTGMASRLMGLFLGKKSKVEIFHDKDLDQAVSKHANFLAFSALTLAAPGTAGTNPAKTRIHQALKKANWDINQVKAITDLGVPAFNLGSKLFSTGDFNNGLGLMINGVQYVLVYVEHYFYDCDQKKYDITLRFVLYDVFGLDDDDLNEYGARTPQSMGSAGKGITAWWQLQHQYNYAPLLTRAEVTRQFKGVTAS